MSKLFYVTKRSYVPGKGRERNEEPSMTIPGESYTIGELMARMKAGGQLPALDRRVEFLDDELDNISAFNRPLIDLTDLDDLRERNEGLTKHIKELEVRRKKLLDDQAAEKALQEARAKSRAEIAAKVEKGGSDA